MKLKIYIKLKIYMERKISMVSKHFSMGLFNATDFLPLKYWYSYTPVLKPNLHHTHIEARLCAQLLTHVSGRFWTLVVCSFQGLELFGSYCGPGAFACVIQSVVTKPLWKGNESDNNFNPKSDQFKNSWNFFSLKH